MSAPGIIALVAHRKSAESPASIAFPLRPLQEIFALNPAFAPITPADLALFQSILPQGRVLTEAEHLHRCAADHTEDLHHPPEVVLEPDSPEQISAILRHCHAQRIPVTARGAGTGLSGGALALHGGVVLDMRRMNRILHIDTANFQVVTEPGVITQVLQEAVLAHDLMYPPDPASRGSCFIGGNVAENSGGPRAVKYGVVKDYVLNLEVVLPSGDIIWTGANTLKNSTGYNLTQLLVGSEGTLGIVTKIVLRLIPAVRHNLLLLAPFRNAVDACRAVNDILLTGITPSALEFMERDALLFSMQHNPGNTIPLPDNIAAHLLIEVDGNDEAALYAQMEQIGALLEAQHDCGELLFADTAAQKETLWLLRRKVGEAVKSHSIYKEEDTVVPRAELPRLLETVKALGREYGFQSVCYGHAGDGNLHVNILRGDMPEDRWRNELPKGIRRLFEEVAKMGGTISGEHGIGLVQKSYLDVVFSEAHMNIMRSIKQVFDPNGILNPGKIF